MKYSGCENGIYEKKPPLASSMILNRLLMSVTVRSGMTAVMPLANRALSVLTL